MTIERRFIHEPFKLVKEWNRAQLYLQPGLQLDEKFSVLYKRGLGHADRVTVISGGGSGHEPAHSGYLGTGMLDVTVSGSIFASPNVRHIYRALEVAASSKGSILVVKNYTGDKLNFALAAEKFKAATGKDVRMVVVADDVSVGRSRGKFVGRRGLAGTVLVHKVVGAAAQRDLSIDEIICICDVLTGCMGTIGTSLTPCFVPGHYSSGPIFDRIELGVGIHNEPAICHLTAETTTEDLICEMLDFILNPGKPEHAYMPPGSDKAGRRLVLLLNNLGGISTIEMGAVTSLVISQLGINYNIIPYRVYAGTFLSALDGRGFSITLLSLDSSEEATTILSLLDDHTSATGWPCSISSEQWTQESLMSHSVNGHSINGQMEKVSDTYSQEIPCNKETFTRIVQCIFDEVKKEEPTITRYDTVLGDGDCGTTLLAGAMALKKGIETETVSNSSLSRGMVALADIVTEAMGGTSGAIYGIFLSAFAAALNRSYNEDCDVNGNCFARAATDALVVLKNFTGARVGDRTLMDSLIPFVVEFELASKELDTVNALKRAIEEATAGCENTRFLESKFGRSTYVDSHVVEGTSGTAAHIPDPGACGIVAVLTGLLKALSD
ncbi:dihydroxyacetone kinase [Penicillium canescens]|nr:dihydroxyacetone kinase [Penicillium canescens]